jgi:hypothetical protein
MGTAVMQDVLLADSKFVGLVEQEKY